jgi:CBS domain containing-hemolysin-like protein
VYEGDLDHVVGVAHLKDIAGVLVDPHRTATVRGLMREAIFAPDILRLDGLLRLMQSRKQHMVIVLDEYGGTAGLVSLDDVVAQIVGEMRGPHDRASPGVQLLPDGSALVDGLMRIEDVNEHFDLNLQDENYDTIAGFILGRLGRLANVGDTADVEGVKLSVESLDSRRISRVSLRKVPIEPDADPTHPARPLASPE